MRTHVKVQPCYDGKRHRWRERERWQRKAGTQLWQMQCERCGQWEPDIRVEKP